MVGKKKKTLFDIGCGKFGELNRWLEVGFDVVIGVDKFKDNLENPIDGAYERLLIKHSNVKGKKYIGIAFDASKDTNET